MEVKELKGVRIVPIDLGEGKQRPEVQYLISWKDGLPDTWCASTKQSLHPMHLEALQWLTACTCISRCTLPSSGPLEQLQCCAGLICVEWLQQQTALVLVMPETPGCRFSAPRLQARQ